MTILVTGARGHIGRVVLDELIDAGESVRASSRDPHPGEFPDGVDVVRADLADPSTFPALVRGVRKIFLYAQDDAVEAFAAQAADAGVEHIVLLSSNSVLFPDAQENPVAKMHMAVEGALEASGIAWTFVRPGYLATNTLRWQSIRTDRVLRTAFPESAIPLVHERDVGAVAVRALLDDSLRGQAFLVLGGERLTVRQQVAAIAEALGEPVGVEEIDVETYRIELSAQLPEIFVERLIGLGGRIPEVPEDVRLDAVPALLGRSPLTYRAWAEEHAGDFR